MAGGHQIIQWTYGQNKVLFSLGFTQQSDKTTIKYNGNLNNEYKEFDPLFSQQTLQYFVKNLLEYCTELRVNGVLLYKEINTSPQPMTGTKIGTLEKDGWIKDYYFINLW